ncbi:MAG: hypothetical protein HZA52_06975 [Planctomycetes bacterium]|nr:hypothetical protein [Planctomycetota bacterium]
MRHDQASPSDSVDPRGQGAQSSPTDADAGRIHGASDDPEQAANAQLSRRSVLGGLGIVGLAGTAAATATVSSTATSMGPSFAVRIEHDPSGRYPFLSRADQISIEGQITSAIMAVLPTSQVAAWESLATPQTVIDVTGATLTLDPETESMSIPNQRRFMDQLLSSATTLGGESLSTNPAASLQPICKVKVGGQHVDGANCRLLIQSASAGVRPWTVDATAPASGEVIRAWISAEFSWLKDNA